MQKLFAKGLIFVFVYVLPLAAVLFDGPPFH